MGTPEGHQKSIFNSPKVKKIQRKIWDLCDKVYISSTQKHEKDIETPNLPIRTKMWSFLSNDGPYF
jgi:hypothetical protein